jgi:hypothetical protein
MGLGGVRVRVTNPNLGRDGPRQIRVWPCPAVAADAVVAAVAGLVIEEVAGSGRVRLALTLTVSVTLLSAESLM